MTVSHVPESANHDEVLSNAHYGLIENFDGCLRGFRTFKWETHKREPAFMRTTEAMTRLAGFCLTQEDLASATLFDAVTA